MTLLESLTVGMKTHVLPDIDQGLAQNLAHRENRPYTLDQSDSGAPSC